MKGRVVFAFADGVYAFAFRAGELEELQDKTDAGPMEVYRRLLSGTWRIADVRETIRLGLLGARKGWAGAVLNEDGEPDGGQEVEVTPALAVRLVRNYVDTYGAPAFDPDMVDKPTAGPLPWAEASVLAAQILEAGLMGRKDEPLGKKPEGETAKDPNLSPAEKSGGLLSSPPSPIEA